MVMLNDPGKVAPRYAPRMVTDQVREGVLPFPESRPQALHDGLENCQLLRGRGLSAVGALASCFHDRANNKQRRTDYLEVLRCWAVNALGGMRVYDARRKMCQGLQGMNEIRANTIL